MSFLGYKLGSGSEKGRRCGTGKVGSMSVGVGGPTASLSLMLVFLCLSMREKISYWLPMSYEAFPSCSRRSRAIICRFYLCSPTPPFSLSSSFGQGIRADHAKHEGSLHKSLIANELFTPHASERKLSMRDRFVNR